MKFDIREIKKFYIKGKIAKTEKTRTNYCTFMGKARQ